MFKIDRTAAGAHLEADAVLTPADFRRIAKASRRAPLRAHKIGYVAARQAAKREVVETRWNGKETTNTAQAGDYIVTNLSPKRQPLRDCDGQLNVYVIAAERFASLYEPAGEESKHGPIYRAKGVVLAIPLFGGFSIAAPWGERQATLAGYLLCNGEEVYGSSREAFEGTYEVEGS
jgi:hypothetical protein